MPGEPLCKAIWERARRATCRNPFPSRTACPLSAPCRSPLGLALVQGHLVTCLRLPVLVGYLLAGGGGDWVVHPGVCGGCGHGRSVGLDRCGAADVWCGPVFLTGRPAGSAQDCRPRDGGAGGVPRPKAGWPFGCRHVLVRSRVPPRAPSALHPCWNRCDVSKKRALRATIKDLLLLNV